MKKNQKTNVRNAMSFKTKLLKFIYPISNTIYNIHNPKDIQQLTSLRLTLSHPRDRKSKQSFLNSTNALWNRDSPFIHRTLINDIDLSEI